MRTQTYSELLNAGKVTFPSNLDSATKQTIFDWFQDRPVVSDDKFNIYFNRVLVRDLPQYYQLLRIEPGVSDYDWMVEEYLEEQRTHEGANDVTVTGGSTVTKTGTVDTAGTSKQETVGTLGKTTGETSGNTRSDTGTSTLEKAGKEKTRDYSDQTSNIGPEGQIGNLTVDYEKYDGNLKVTDKFATDKNKYEDKLEKSGKQTVDKQSQEGDGDTVTLTKSGAENHTINDSRTADHTITKNGTRSIEKTADAGKNYDVNSGGVKTTKNLMITESETETPGVTDTVTTTPGVKETVATKNNQASATDTKSLSKTLPMSTAGSDFATASADADSAITATGSDVPGFNWSNASAMSEGLSTTAYSGDADTQVTSREGNDKQVTTHSGDNQKTVTRREGGTDDEGNDRNVASNTTDTTKVSHAVDTSEKETFSDYKEDDKTTESTTNHTDDLEFQNRQDKTVTENHLNQKETTEFEDYKETRTVTDNREKVSETEYPTKKTNSHYEVFDNKKELSFEDRKDTTTDNRTITDNGNRSINENQNTSDTVTGESHNLVTNNLSDVTDSNQTTAGTDTTLDRMVHTGRHGEPAQILARAAGYIKSSSAWSWLSWRLEPCFLGIYDV